jgi:hypothetical protein
VRPIKSSINRKNQRMKRREGLAWVLAAALGAVVGLASSSPARGAEFERPITLREPLGFTWTDELVHRDEALSEPRVAAATLSLEDAAGKAVPLQVEVLEGKPESVRRVRLWWKATLPAGRSVTYQLTYNDENRKADAPAGGVSVGREGDGGDRLVIRGGGSAPLPASGVDVAVAAPTAAFPRPREMAASPAPFLGVRPSGNETWRGEWSLAGPARVREIQTQVLAAGPVWAEVNVKYLFEDRNQSYEVTIRVVRDEPWADVREKTRLPVGCRMTAALRWPRGQAEAIWMPWFVDRDGHPQPAYDVQRLALDEKVRPGEPFATLRPRWTQSPANTQVLLANVLGIPTMRPEPNGPPPPTRPAVVGAVAVGAGDWVRPYDQLPTARVLDGRDGVAIDFPLVDGERHWALVAGATERLDSKAELQRLIRKNADLPLDRVLNDWVFQWPRRRGDPAPHVLTTWPRLEQITGDLAADRDTAAVRLVRKVQRGEVPGDRNFVDYLLRRRETFGPSLAAPALYLERSYQDELFSPLTYARHLAADMQRADLSYPGRPGGGAAAALVGYLFADPDFRPGRAGGWDAGPPDLLADSSAVLVIAAASIPDHPAAKSWMAAGVAGLKDVLRQAVVMPGGAGTENPARMVRTLASLLGPMQAARNAGGEDAFRWPEMRAALEFLRNLHTPVDPRVGRRTLAALGETAGWQDDAGAVFGMAALGLRDSDPKLAAVDMAMYRHYYDEKGGGDLVRDILQVDQSLAAAPLADAGWAGRAYPGFGAVLRSGFGSPHEAFAAFKCGAPRGHTLGDEMGFEFYGAASPLVPGWRCGPRFSLVQEHMHNRVTLGDDENMDAAGDLLASSFGPAADVAVGQVKADHLRQMPRFPGDVTPGAAYPRRTLEKEARYRRFLLLVKHPDGKDGDRGPIEDYLVVRDELAAADPATFNLFVLARGVRQTGQTFRFEGQLGTDTAVFFAAPEADKVVLDAWGWPKADESAMIPRAFRPGTDTWRGGELQQWLRVTAPPGQPFLAVVYPVRPGTPAPAFESLAGGRGVRVTVGDASEEVYLSTDPAPGAGGQAVIRRGGKDTVILKAGAVPGL